MCVCILSTKKAKTGNIWNKKKNLSLFLFSSLVHTLIPISCWESHTQTYRFKTYINGMKLYVWLGNLPFPQCPPHFTDFLCQYTANDPIPSNHHTAFHSGDVHNLFKHFSLDGQLHSFHFFPSPDKAAVNILVHSCGLVRVSLWVTGLQVLCWRNIPLKCYRYCQTAF